jgi:hypothetical protein
MHPRNAWPLLWGRAGLITVSVLAPLVALLLLARRLTGQLSPLPGAGLIIVGVIAALAAIAWRLAWRWGASDAQSWQARLATYAPATVLVILLAALSIRGTPGWALGIFWLTLIGEELFAGWWFSPAAGARRSVVEHEEVETSTCEEEESASLLPAGVTQQITRVQQDHREVLTCLLRATFEINQQHAALHIAFCPPLATTPTAILHQLDGPPCDARLTDSATYGARLELKRRGPLTLADEVLLSVEFESAAGE